MFAVYVTALLCWLAMSHSAPLFCENLLQSLDHLDFQHLRGRWALIAGSQGNATYLDKFNSRDSVAIVFANSSNSSETSLTRIFNANGSCQYMQMNFTVEGSSFSVGSRGVTGTFLKASCDDCILMDFDNATKKHRRLYLFSRKREVEQKEMEEFTAQAACLNMTVPIWKDPTKMLCPEQMPIEPTPKAEERRDEKPERFLLIV